MIEAPVTNLNLALRSWTDGSKHVISGNKSDLINWVENFPYNLGAIYVVSDEEVIYDLNKVRPDLTFYWVKSN